MKVNTINQETRIHQDKDQAAVAAFEGIGPHLLVGINAKYIHSNLAIRYIKAYASHQDLEIELLEQTINQDVDAILDAIMDLKPRSVGFSCYLWNIHYVKQLVQMLKTLRPHLFIHLGGPEVSYNPEEVLKQMPVDCLVIGEGEVTTTALLKAYQNQETLESIDGLAFLKEGQCKVTKSRSPMPMEDLPFVYNQSVFETLENRILYYETSRGCPYNCRYCLSSIEKGVRFRPLPMVYRELQVFLDAKVTQVKFVDRTFNARKDHARGIWAYLMAHDNGITNFHFEITADLLDDETIQFLKGARPGLFQFEIGVQSTNPATILDIDRKMDFLLLKQRVLQVMAGNNIHIHLDLIAGLPKEDYHAFRNSFNDVMAIRPQQLQLGFLKVLKGSMIHRLKETYGIVHRDFAPYEVLYTNELSYEALRRLKRIEALLEWYYNSNLFVTSMDYLMRLHANDFECFEALETYYSQEGLFLQPLSRLSQIEALYKFGQTNRRVDLKLLANFLKHDMCTREKPKKWPSFISHEDKVSEVERRFYQSSYMAETILQDYKSYSAKQISRMGHFESYDVDVLSLKINPEFTQTYVFYNYLNRDPMTHSATMSRVPIDLIKEDL